jgi:hypothetical protein
MSLKKISMTPSGIEPDLLRSALTTTPPRAAVKRSGISNITHHHHHQNPKEQNEILISKEKSITDMKVKHKRRHKK